MQITLTSNYWKLTDGFGDQEKHLEYARKSLDRLKTKYPFLTQYPAYLDFLNNYGGLTLEPIGNNDSIGTLWGTGANIPHLLDEEGDPLEETPFFFFADIVEHRKNFSFAFYFDSSSAYDKVYAKIYYYEGYDGERKNEKDSLFLFAENFLQFLNKVLNNYSETVKELV